jgi:hypothetical protein
MHWCESLAIDDHGVVTLGLSGVIISALVGLFGWQSFKVLSGGLQSGCFDLQSVIYVYSFDLVVHRPPFCSDMRVWDCGN